MLGGEQARTAYEAAVRTVASLGETGRASWRLLRSLRPLAVVLLLAPLAVAGAVAVVLAWVVPAVAGWVAALPAAATLVALYVIVGHESMPARPDRKINKAGYARSKNSLFAQ
jgi:hypothetical protein